MALLRKNRRWQDISLPRCFQRPLHWFKTPSTINGVPPAAPTKKKKKANSPKSVKTEVGLTLEIRILRKKTPRVVLPRKQSKDVVLNHDATRDKHSDLLKYSELMIIAADIYWACTLCLALCWVVCLVYSWRFTDPTLSSTTLMEKSEISSCFLSSS